jgi:hypothetical protein
MSQYSVYNAVYVNLSQLMIDYGMNSSDALAYAKKIGCDNAQFCGIKMQGTTMYGIYMCSGHKRTDGKCSSGNYTRTSQLSNETITIRSQLSVAANDASKYLHTMNRSTSTETYVGFKEGCAGHTVCGGHTKCAGHYSCEGHDVDYCTGHATRNVKGYIADYYEKIPNATSNLRTQSWKMYKEAKFTAEQVAKTPLVKLEGVGESIKNWFVDQATGIVNSAMGESSDPAINQNDLATFSWDGEYVPEYCDGLVEADWYNDYGFNLDNDLSSTSGIRVLGPIEPSKAEWYIKNVESVINGKTMTEQEKATRLAVTKFAIESVGTVPYYSNGRPSANGSGQPYKGYEKNNFGSPLAANAADEQGRTLKGLDSEGWIYWVYNSVSSSTIKNINTNLLVTPPSAFTSTNLTKLPLINRYNAKPGDLVFLGSDYAGILLYFAKNGNAVVAYENENHENIGISSINPAALTYRSAING